MINYIVQRIKAAQRKRLLASIVETYPDLVDYEDEERFHQYLALAVGAYTKAQEYHDEVYGVPAPDQPRNLAMPPLLTKVLEFWADRPPAVYALLMIQKVIEVTDLTGKLTRYEQIEELRQQQEGLVLQLADAANKVVEDVNKSVLPGNRLN